MGLFDVFKKNDNSEGGEYHNMERSAEAPTAEEVRQAVDFRRRRLLPPVSSRHRRCSRHPGLRRQARYFPQSRRTS